MKNYITEVTTKKTQKLVSTICDKCGKKTEPTLLHDAYHPDWFFCETGNKSDRGGAGEIKSIDLCWRCTEDLVKLMKDNGYRIKIERWDY